MAMRQCVRRCVLVPGRALLLSRTQVTLAGDKGGAPKLTLADNPNIIVAWHPPTQQVSVKKTKPTYSTPPTNTLNEAQVSVLERLVTEDPYVWDPPSLAALFEVKEKDVIDNIEVPRHIRDKIKARDTLLTTWGDKDRQAMRSYQEKQRVKCKVELYLQDKELFKHCTFDEQDLQLNAHFVGLKVPQF